MAESLSCVVWDSKNSYTAEAPKEQVVVTACVPSEDWKRDTFLDCWFVSFTLPVRDIEIVFQTENV